MHAGDDGGGVSKCAHDDDDFRGTYTCVRVQNKHVGVIRFHHGADRSEALRCLEISYLLLCVVDRLKASQQTTRWMRAVV